MSPAFSRYISKTFTYAYKQVIRKKRCINKSEYREERIFPLDFIPAARTRTNEIFFFHSIPVIQNLYTILTTPIGKSRTCSTIRNKRFNSLFSLLISFHFFLSLSLARNRSIITGDRVEQHFEISSPSLDLPFTPCTAYNGGNTYPLFSLRLASVQ